MQIAVCIKQVVTREWQLRVAESGTWIRDTDASFELNEPDAYALEEALRLKEKHGGEVVVCSAGPARVAQVIREALARGADRAIHVESDALADVVRNNTAAPSAVTKRSSTRPRPEPAPCSARSNSRGSTRNGSLGATRVTSVDIDTETLRLAKSSLGVRTNREAINLALRDVVMRRRQIEAIDILATIPIDSDATTIEYGD